MDRQMHPSSSNLIESLADQQVTQVTQVTQGSQADRHPHRHRRCRSCRPIHRSISPPLQTVVPACPLGEECAPRKAPHAWRQQRPAAGLHRGGFRRSVGRRRLAPGAGDVHGEAPAQRLAPAGGGVAGGKQPIFGGQGAPADTDTKQKDRQLLQ